MAYQQVALELVRDGQCTPWGFRMTGGADIGAPLVIQKVSLGSPAEGELQRGDLILAIREYNATNLSHQGATDLISRAGSTIRLIVARSSCGGGVSAPGSPGHDFGPFFKPLPTTQQRHRRTSTESYTSTTSSDTDKDNISNQPYRSIPLILPGAKSTKDLPTGSYLRFDPISRTTSSHPNQVLRFGAESPFMHNKVQEAIIGAAQTSSGLSSPGRTPTPDMNHNGPVFLRQYNTPIHMYSNQAIVEALAAQTIGMTQSPIRLMPDIMEAKKDIKQSPTYQLIHDEEWKKGPVVEHEPLQEHVYNVNPRGDGYRPEDIHQSGSFKSIMNDLKGMSDF